MLKIRALFLYGILQAISFGALAQDVVSPMVVHYSSPPGHAFLHVYKVELIVRALEITRPEFGDYQLKEFNGDNPNDQRRVILINDGSLVNLLWAPSGSIVTKAEVIEIPFDVLHGLLGYRVCLRNSTVPSLLNGVNNLEDLQKIRIGQGEEWPDIKIYEANQKGLGCLFLLVQVFCNTMPLKHISDESSLWKQIGFILIEAKKRAEYTALDLIIHLWNLLCIDLKFF